MSSSTSLTPSLNPRQHSTTSAEGNDEPPTRIPQPFPMHHPAPLQRSHSLRLRTDLPDFDFLNQTFPTGVQFVTDASTTTTANEEDEGGSGGGGDCKHNISSKSAPETNTGCRIGASISPESKENRPAAGQYRRQLPITKSLTSLGGGASSSSPGMAHHHHHHGHSNGSANHKSCNHHHISHGGGERQAASESCGTNQTSNSKCPSCSMSRGSASNGGSRHHGMVSM